MSQWGTPMQADRPAAQAPPLSYQSSPSTAMLQAYDQKASNSSPYIFSAVGEVGTFWNDAKQTGGTEKQIGHAECSSRPLSRLCFYGFPSISNRFKIIPKGRPAPPQLKTNLGWGTNLRWDARLKAQHEMRLKSPPLCRRFPKPADTRRKELTGIGPSHLDFHLNKPSKRK